MENEALDFELDKTYKTLFEAGKLKSSAFSTYLLLLATTSLLVLGHGNQNQVKVPFIELTLNKNLASAVLLVSSCIALYWYNITHIKQWLLRVKLSSLYRERYGKNLDVNWHIGYPTPLWIPTSSAVAPLPPLLAVLANAIFILLSVASYIAPVLLSWEITSAYYLATFAKVFISLLLITSALIAQLIISFDRRMSPKISEGYLREKFERQSSSEKDIGVHEGDV
jgi:hypothetical protein